MFNILTRLILQFAILLFLAKPSFAVDSFSWKQCIDLAAHNNASLKAAIDAEKASKYQRNAAFSGFLPQATATLSSNRGNNGNASNPSLTTVQSSVTQAYTGSITVTQNLFSGFSDVGKVKQADANNLVAQASIDIVKAQVSYDLKYAYENFNYAKDTVELLDNIIHRREDNLRIIELRYKGGMENKGSVLLAQAYLEQAKYDRLQGTNLIESARAQLCKAIGLGECGEYDIANAVPVRTPTKSANFQELIEAAPQHQQAVAQEKAAKAGVTISESAFYPIVNLNASKGQRGASFFPQNDYWAVGFNVSIPFFTGGKDYFTMKSAYSNSSAASENRRTVDQQLLVALKQSYNAYVESVAKLKVDESFRSAAKLRAEIARNKYNNGLLIFEDWDAIETDLITRQKSYLQSKLSRVTSEASWEQAQGKGVFNDE